MGYTFGDSCEKRAVFGCATEVNTIIGDSLAAKNMPTGDGVGSPLTVVRFVADVATRIRMYHKHIRGGVEGPYTGGGVRKGRARGVRKKNRLELHLLPYWGHMSPMSPQLGEGS